MRPESDFNAKPIFVILLIISKWFIIYKEQESAIQWRRKAISKQTLALRYY